MRLSTESHHRSRALARTLHARLFVDQRGLVQVTSGHPLFAVLSAALRRMVTQKELPGGITPSDLGVLNDGELGPELLNALGRALNRWQIDCNVERAQRPARRRGIAELEKEHRELQQLAARWQRLKEWRTRLAAGDPPAGAPLFLSMAEERTLASKLRRAPAAANSTIVSWLARVVAWLDGPIAVERFLAAVEQINRFHPASGRSQAAEHLWHQIRVWMRQLQFETTHAVFERVKQELSVLPQSLRNSAQLRVRPKGRPFLEYCEDLSSDCLALVNNDILHREALLPALLAAWAAADGAKARLPVDRLRPGVEREDYSAVAKQLERLANEIGRPAYAELLRAVEQFPPEFNDWDWLRKTLADGATVDDALWCWRARLQDCVGQNGLSAPKARKLHQEFQERGMRLETDRFSQLLRFIRVDSDMVPVRNWLAWLGSVPRSSVSSSLGQELQQIFFERYLPATRIADCRERLFRWLPSLSKKDLTRSTHLQVIEEAQELVGHRGLPKSLRKFLSHQDRQQSELAHLASLRSRQPLPPAAEARFHHLQRQLAKPVRPQGKKTRGKIDAAFLRCGLAAITTTLQTLADVRCRETLSYVTDAILPRRRWDFSLWLGRMSAEQRQLLRAIVEGRQRYGTFYKRRLAENLPWLERAAAQGLRLSPWFGAAPQVVEVASEGLEISLQAEIHELLLMGEYFGTCLGLNGPNAMSVLSNAYDANKQVLFLFRRTPDGQRRVIGRKLLAISADFQLLGYHCYLQESREQPALRNPIEAAISAYCGRLAAQCGLSLAQEGEPESIGEHFWYDDGACEWDQAAQGAWDAARSLESPVLAPSAMTPVLA